MTEEDKGPVDSLGQPWRGAVCASCGNGGFRPDEKGHPILRCMKYPPVPIFVGLAGEEPKIDWQQPPVKADGWCFGHRHRSEGNLAPTMAVRGTREGEGVKHE